MEKIEWFYKASSTENEIPLTVLMKSFNYDRFYNLNES